MAFYPNAGALRMAEVAQAAFAGAELRLWKSGDVDPSAVTTLAELDAAECDFDGYAAITITAWNDPALNPLGGASIQASAQFNTASPWSTGNVAGGYYIVDMTGTPEVLVIQPFPSPGIEMSGPGQAIPLTQLLLYGTPNV